MRICVIGNSHTASLKLGWAAVHAEYPDVVLTVFASLGHTMQNLVADNGRLVAKTPKLAKRMAETSGTDGIIRIQDFDAFVLYGLPLNLPRFELGMSRAFQRAAMNDVFRTSVLFSVLHAVRSVTDKPVYCSPSPLIALGSVEPDVPMLDYLDVVAVLREIVAGSRVDVLGQPLETVRPNLSTAVGHSLKAGDLADDVDATHVVLEVEPLTKHMNAEFGVLWLRANLPTILAG